MRQCKIEKMDGNGQKGQDFFRISMLFEIYTSGLGGMIEKRRALYYNNNKRREFLLGSVPLLAAYAMEEWIVLIPP